MRRLVTWLLFAASLAWAATLVAAPHALVSVAGPRTLSNAAAAVYIAGSYICHQRPDRSFRAAGRPFPVCGRCTGLYLGAPIGLAAVLAWGRPWRSRPRRRTGNSSEMPPGGKAYPWWRFVLIGAALPTIVSVGLERGAGLFWDGLPGNIGRALAAVPLGAAVAALVGAVCYTSRSGSGGD